MLCTVSIILRVYYTISFVSQRTFFLFFHLFICGVYDIVVCSILLVHVVDTFFPFYLSPRDWKLCICFFFSLLPIILFRFYWLNTRSASFMFSFAFAFDAILLILLLFHFFFLCENSHFNIWNHFIRPYFSFQFIIV